MLHRIDEDISQFGAVNFLDASQFEHYIYVLKKCIMMTSMQCGSALEEAVGAMNSSVGIEER